MGCAGSKSETAHQNGTSSTKDANGKPETKTEQTTSNTDNKTEEQQKETEPEVVQTEVKATDEPSAIDDANKPEEESPTKAEE